MNMDNSQWANIGLYYLSFISKRFTILFLSDFLSFAFRINPFESFSFSSSSAFSFAFQPCVSLSWASYIVTSQPIQLTENEGLTTKGIDIGLAGQLSNIVLRSLSDGASCLHAIVNRSSHKRTMGNDALFLIARLIYKRGARAYQIYLIRSLIYKTRGVQMPRSIYYVT